MVKRQVNRVRHQRSEESKSKSQQTAMMLRLFIILLVMHTLYIGVIKLTASQAKVELRQGYVVPSASSLPLEGVTSTPSLPIPTTVRPPQEQSSTNSSTNANVSLALAVGCHKSMHQMAVDMVQESSPSNSSSWNKSRNMLSTFRYFHIHLHAPIFADNTANIVAMLEGYGLQQILPEQIIVCSPEMAQTTILVESTLFATLGNSRLLNQQGNCTDMPKILLQTEQLLLNKKIWNDYLQACETSDYCVIWDFSDSNLLFLRDQLNIRQSAIHAPILFHQRLGVGPATMKPMQERQVDVAMYAFLTRRRKIALRRYFYATQNASWVVKIASEKNVIKLKAFYNDSRICMIIHSYGDESAGEYHRMSEVAPYGCRLVVEDVADNVLRSTLESCGGVSFSKKANLTNTIAAVLDSTRTHKNDEQHRLYTDWWKNGIDWPRLAEDIFGSRVTSGA